MCLKLKYVKEPEVEVRERTFEEKPDSNHTF